MPIHQGKDIKGNYLQWGSQKKYYYNPTSIQSEKKAYDLAARQARAIYSTGYKG